MGNLFGGRKRALTPLEREIASALKSCSLTVRKLIEKDFGEQFSQGDTPHQLRKWLYNICLNLDTAVQNLEKGRDRHGGPLDPEKLKSGLLRMCDDYSVSEYMIKLERSMGTGIRDEVRRIVALIRENVLKINAPH
jgi:hypothetical protein